MGSIMEMNSRSHPTPPLEPMTAMVAMMSKLNVPSRGRSVAASPARSRSDSVRSVPTRNGSVDRHMPKLSTNSLRSFRLGGGEGRVVRVAPTFQVEYARRCGFNWMGFSGASATLPAGWLSASWLSAWLHNFPPQPTTVLSTRCT